MERQRLLWLERLAGPLTLVCTHGARDACCAKNGGMFFRALRKLSPDTVWQSSHLGGHRFAATAIHFPSGRLFGRLDAQNAESFVHQEPPDLIERLRGLTRYDKPSQFMEIELLKENRKGLSLVEQVQLDLNAWTVRFDSDEGRLERIVTRTETGRSRCASCGDAEASTVYDWTMRDD